MYPDGEEVRYGYDGGGQVCSVKGVKQGVEFVYVADIEYDEYGQRTYMEYGNGVKTNYTYDEDRRWLSNIKTGIAGLTYQDMDYSFDAMGNVAGYVNDADGYRTEQHYEYDGLYQLTGVKGVTVNRPSGYDQYRAEYSQSYTFDELGLGNMMRKESESTVVPTYDLKGDELNYLLEYEYDAKAAHRVTRIGERFYRYDGNGNVVEEVSANGDGETELDTAVYEEGEGVYRSDYGWAERNPDASSGGGGNKGYRRSYIWNERNLMSQSADSRYTVTYRYGSDGQRATKYARGMNESETMYFSRMWEWRYDEAAGGRERNSKHIFLGETRVVTKVLADASVVAGERESEYFYHSDHLGSAQLISDYEGREYERIEYTPYGETWVDRKEAVDTIELTYRFTGKEVDEETGLYYYGARYLDPRTSRWLSTDPALGEYIPGAPVDEEAKKANQNLPGMGGVFNVVNFQLYHYAGNNPVKYVDPDGKSALGAVLGALSVDMSIPDPSDALLPKWGGWVAAIVVGAIIDAGLNWAANQENKPSALPTEGAESGQSTPNSNDLTNSDEWPENPDNWTPPDGVTEEQKTKESTQGRHRQWKDRDGNIIRRWDASGREYGKDRGTHWHDENGNHILPGGEIQN